LDHQSVALKAGKVRSDRVVGHAQRVREFVHSALSSPEELKDFSPGTFEQAVSPAYMFH
jgi:hypothetical protein